MRITRRKFIGSLVTSVPCGIGYTSAIEPNWLDVSHTPIRLSATPLPAPVRLLHLSDFHLSSDVPLSLIANAIRRGIGERPDVICVTGDFVTDKLSFASDYTTALKRLADTAPTFATMGNHDGGRWSRSHGGYETSDKLRDFVAGAGIRVLHNETTDIRIRGTTLRFAGLGDIWADESKPADTFARPPQDAAHAHLLLSHNPDSKDDLKNYRWDLMLAGHTHGGQASLPFIGGGRFAPVRDKRFIAGRYDWEGRQLFITRGVGSILGLRFNCRPEVSILNLV